MVTYGAVRVQLLRSAQLAWRYRFRATPSGLPNWPTAAHLA